jgi:autotransporter-associated beta strand protein
MKPKTNIFRRRISNKPITAPISVGMLGLVVLFGTAIRASAVDLYWFGDGSAFDWNSAGNGGNWTYYDNGFFYSADTPTAADLTIFGWLDNPTTVNVTPGATASSVWVADGTASFNLQGNTLEIVNGLRVGDGFNGTLNASGGIINSSYMDVGVGTGNTGVVNLTNMTLNTGSILSWIGYEGSGSVDLGTGAVWNAGAAISIGQNSGTGAVNLTSATSLLNAGDIYFGFDGGAGSLSVSSGATVNAQGFFKGTGSGTITIDNGILRAQGNETDFISGFSSGDVNIGLGGVTIDTQGFNIGISSPLEGTGALTKTGSGFLTLSGTNAYEGGTLIDGTGGGGISISSEANLGQSVGILTFENNGTLRVTAPLTMERMVILGSGGGTIDSGVNDLTLSGEMTGTGGLSLSSEGSVTFAGVNKSYTGATSLLGGTLVVQESGGLAGESALSLAAGSILDASNSHNQLAGGLSGSGGMILGTGEFSINSASDETFSGIISGAGSLGKTGAGLLTLQGNNTHLGGTLVDGANGGGLSISSDSNLGDSAGALSIVNNGVLQITAGITSARNVNIDSLATLHPTSGTSTFSGVISGNAALVKTGAGALALTGTNTFSGDTTVEEGRLIVNSDSSFGNTGSSIYLGEATTLETTASINTSRTIVVNGTSADLEVAAGTTFAIEGGISGGGIQKTGNGTLMLSGSGSSDYGGDTIVSAGSLRAGAAGVFSLSSDVSLAAGTNLNLDGHDQTIRALSGSGSVLLGAGTLTTQSPVASEFSGVISGTGGLVKSWAGELTLLNTTSSYSGGTTVTGEGTLIIAGDASLGSSSGGITLDNGYLKLKSGIPLAETSNRAVTLGLSSGTFDTNGRNWTLNGVISGDGGLAKTGAGTLVLGNSGNSYLGGTLLFEGAIQISSNAALGDLSGAVYLWGGSLIVDGNVVSNREFAGGGPLIKEGEGMLHLTNTSNGYSGPTVVNQGVLRFNSDANLGAVSSDVILNGGSLSATANLSSSRNLILSQDSGFEVLGSARAILFSQITGNHTLTKTGTGMLDIRGNNFHEGFVVNQGTLLIFNNSSIGGSNSSLTVRNNSQLQFGSSGTITRDIKLGQATLNTGNSNVTLMSLQSDPDSSYYSAVTKTGSGSLTVLSSTKNGSFQVAQGALRPGANNALESHELINLTGSLASLNLNGFNANIRALSGMTGSSVALGSNTLTIFGSSIYSGNFAGNISGTGGLAITGSAYQTLSGTNTYSGGTTVSGGHLIFATPSAVPVSGLITNTAYTGAGFAMDQTFLDRFDKGASSGVLGVQVDSGNNLDLSGFSPNASIGTNISGSGVTLSGSITPQESTYRFAGGYGRLNVASDLSGANALHADSLRVHLSGTNSFANGVTAGSDGIVVFDNASSLPATGSLTALSNGYVGSALPVDQAFLDRFDKANTQGVIGLNSSSSNNLDLTGFGSGASLGTVENVTVSGLITPQGANYRFGGVTGHPRGTMTVQSNLTGSRGVDIGNINLILAGSNTYNGPTTVSSGGTVQADDNSRLGLGKLILNAGTYHPTASFASTREIEIINYGNILTNSGVTLTQNGNITGNSQLYKYGSGTVVLNGNNVLGSVTVYDGTVRFGSANSITSVTNLTTYYGGTAELGSTSQAINHLYQSGGVVDLGTANLTINSGNLYDGQITGSGALVKTSAGSLTITQTNTHSGGTVLQQGNTYIQSGGALGTGTLTLSGGTLNNQSALTLTLANNVAVSASSTIMTGNGEDTGMTFNGALSGSGNITKTGSGDMTLAGNSSHSGTITVADGTLRLIGSTGSALVANTSTSIITGDGATTGAISIGNGALLSPGNSPGTLEVGSATFASGGIYDWEIAGVSGNHDRISATGTINITATDLNPFIIRVISLDGSNNPGFVPDFNMASSYMWILASGSSISGFDAAKFELDLSAFHNPAVTDQFSIGTSGNNLVLNYNTPGVIPEPSGAMLMLFGSGALLGRRRRGN